MAITAPTDIANCGMWVRGNDAAGAPGTTITSVTDASGNGRNLTGIAGKLPTVATAGPTAFPDGRKSFQFSGAQGFTAPNFAYNDFTIAVVFRPEAWSSLSQNFYYATSGVLYASEAPGAAADYGMAVGSTGNLVCGTGNPDTFVVGGGLALNTWYVGIMDRAQSSGLFHSFIGDLSGNIATVGQATNNTSPLNASTTVGIGCVPSAAEGFLTGKIAEISAFTRVLSAAERQDLVNYYKQAYTFRAVPISLDRISRQIRIPSISIDRFTRTGRTLQPREPIPFKRGALSETLTAMHLNPPKVLRTVPPDQYSTKTVAPTTGQLWPRGRK